MSVHTEKRFLAGDRSPRTATDIEKTIHNIPALLTICTRCGKAGCRCTAGRLHGPYYVLHWREGSVQRRRYVRPADVPAVRAIIEKRREERRVERLALALSMRSWRELARQLEDLEARIREERERR